MTSYGSNEGFLLWMEGQGLTIPATADPDVLRQIGSSYVDAAYEWRLACSSRAGGFNQELAWPRSGHYVNGKSVPDDLIPAAWINASYRAAYLQATNPGWATTSEDVTRQTRREKVDVIEVEYFSNADAVGTDAAPGMPSDTIINGMVLSWLCSNTRSLNSLFRVV